MRYGGGDRLAEIVGPSRVAGRLRTQIDAVAAGTAPVLVSGPTGSGKRLVADLLHQRGTHAAHALVAVRGDESFDLRRVAQTTAGTLVVTGIEVLAPATQAHLTDLIDSGDAPWRIIATSRDLRAAVVAGRFRADLFERLAASEIVVPPLADRRDDIPALVEWLVARVADRPPRFTPAAIGYLARQDWPENVRSLAAVVARAGSFDVDEAAAALLVHGERRRVDRWLASHPMPLAMPNRRRPPPLVAADDADLDALLGPGAAAAIRVALEALAPRGVA